jgi:hypothetical protein
MRASAGAANAPPPGAHASPPAAARRPRLRTLDKAPGPSQAPSVSYQQQLQFERKGHCVLPALLDPGDVERLRVDVEAAVAAGRLQALRHRLRVLCPGIDPATVTSEVAAQRLLENEASDELGFLQFFNLHRQRAGVARLAASPALAGAAAQLLGVRKLRLYQARICCTQLLCMCGSTCQRGAVLAQPTWRRTPSRTALRPRAALRRARGGRHSAAALLRGAAAGLRVPQGAGLQRHQLALRPAHGAL